MPAAPKKPSSNSRGAKVIELYRLTGTTPKPPRRAERARRSAVHTDKPRSLPPTPNSTLPAFQGDYAEWQAEIDKAHRKENRLSAERRYLLQTELHRISQTENGEVLFRNFADAVRQSINDTCMAAVQGTAGPHYAAVGWILQMKSPEQVAKLALQTVIDYLNKPALWTKLVNLIGAVCETECRAGRLKAVKPEAFALLAKNLRPKAKGYIVSTPQLRKVGIAAMPWGAEGRAVVGAFLLDRVMEATGLIEHRYMRDAATKKRMLWIVPVPEVIEFLQKMPPSVTEAGAATRTKAIRVIPPEPWTPDNCRDYLGPTPFGGLITLPSYVATQEEEKTLDWMSPGALDKVLAAANYLQGQPFTINPAFTSILRGLWDADVGQPLMPCSRKPADVPPRLPPQSDQKLWKQRNRAAALAYRDHAENGPARVAMVRILDRAEKLAGHPVWYSVNADYRGRLYAATRLSYQAPERERSFIEFKDGEPLTQSGLEWLLMAAAGHYNRRRLSYPERLRWGQEKLNWMVSIGRRPEETRQGWQEAREPWHFLSICMALARWREDASAPIGTIVWIDQTCSGLGHMAALARDYDLAVRTGMAMGPDGEQVHPDLYELVARACMEQAQRDFENPGFLPSGQLRYDVKRRAEFWLKKGISRGMVKLSVLSAPLGMGVWGARWAIAKKLLSETKTVDLKRLLHEVDGPSRYLSKILQPCIESFIGSASEVQKWLRSAATKVGNLNLPLEWVSPVGLVIRNAELTTGMQEFPTCLNGRAFSYRHMAPEKDARINTRALASSISANFVQSIDASHCTNVVLRCKAEKIPVASVHDCHATTPNHAGRLHNICLEEMRKLHQVDLLEDLRQQFQGRYRFTLPAPPTVGTLDPEKIGSNPLLFH